MTAIIVIFLRIVGLIWAIGAVFIMKNARDMDDRDAARWVFTGGVLTFVAGILLAAGSRWAITPVVLLAVQQAVFHWRQTRGLPPDAERPSPTQVRIAVLVAVATAVLVYQGALV